MATPCKTPSSPEEITKKSNSFLSWMMEFSKKIIFYTFLIYIIIHIFIIVMTAIDYFKSGNMQCLDTLISEVNQTFRDVIGGYIIKAAVENVSKYSGNILDSWLELQKEKLRASGERYVSEDVTEKDGVLWRSMEKQ